MREIPDSLKHDLEEVVCDNLICSERGEYRRCYLDIYRNCPKYPQAKLLEYLGLDKNLKIKKMVRDEIKD